MKPLSLYDFITKNVCTFRNKGETSFTQWHLWLLHKVKQPTIIIPHALTSNSSLFGSLILFSND